MTYSTFDIGGPGVQRALDSLPGEARLLAVLALPDQEGCYPTALVLWVRTLGPAQAWAKQVGDTEYITHMAVQPSDGDVFLTAGRYMETVEAGWRSLVERHSMELAYAS